MDLEAAKHQLSSEGFAILPNFTSASTIENLKTDIQPLLARAGTRNLHRQCPSVADFLQSKQALHSFQTLAPGSFPVRTLFFDKTPDANWKVPWHQDLTICVQERHDLPGFSGWSIKDGVLHVQPPSDILDRMLTIRLHLDDCGPDNGPLRVLPRSHKHGRLTFEQITRLQNTTTPVTCSIPSGGALLMKPLLLHSSSPANKPSHRRVLHIELASEQLPPPLRWLSDSLP